jgi:hypothetical protein
MLNQGIKHREDSLSVKPTESGFRAHTLKPIVPHDNSVTQLEQWQVPVAAEGGQSRREQWLDLKPRESKEAA